MTVSGTILVLTVWFSIIFEQGWKVDASLPRFPDKIANNPEVLGYKIDHDRIVGGQEAKPGQVSFIASIQRVSPSGALHHFCGGSIVNEWTVISAGHCAKGQRPKKVKISVGCQTLYSENCITFDVVEIILHEKYNPSTVENDISVFKLASPISFDNPDVISPVKLPTQEQETAPDTLCFVSGWGTLSEGGNVSPTLQYVEVPTVSDAYCKNSYGEDEIYVSMICAGLTEGGRDSCQGDSGGPMVDSKTNALLGIVSWGYGCARPGYPGVYTNVPRFVDWLIEKSSADSSTDSLISESS